MLSQIDGFFTRCQAQSDGCWIWLGAKTPTGYGTYTFYDLKAPNSTKTMPVHRASYILFHGSIPDGLEIHHKCNVKLCVNPDHLEAVTRSENMKAAWRDRREKIAMPNPPWEGYALKEKSNSRRSPSNKCNEHKWEDGWKQCKICQKSWRERNADYIKWYRDKRKAEMSEQERQDAKEARREKDRLRYGRKKEYRCTLCDELGHNRRGCPNVA